MTEENGAEKANGAEVEENTPTTETSPLEENIIRQVEYYFGDMNLPRDKFLQEQVKLDEGWVPLDIMLKFKRLAGYSADAKVIIEALKKSENSLLEISEDEKKIRRSPELPLPELNEDRRKELLTRSVYVKGFPKDSTIDTCLEYFKQHLTPDCVMLRKYQDRQTKIWRFKGSVFVTFKTREDAEQFMKLGSVKINDEESIRKWQKDYMEEKRIETEARRGKKKKSGDDNSVREEEKSAFILPVGTVLHITEVTPKITKETIREAVTNLGGEVAYVDFQMGDKEGWIRLKVENSAKDVFEKCKDGKISIDSEDIPCQLLEGEKEKEFLDRMTQELVKRRQSQKSFKGNKNKRFKGGKQNYSKKRKGPQDDGPSNKKTKF